ncbi:MAG: glycosyltransferase family 2 protein [Candidatus Eremiobacteraeota bacterium]|nr:glycosyltransferase family 2 protein [Candidatus Eremiobacteraeota bacterium]
MNDVEVVPRISVCICTRNRPAELTLALRSLERSSVAIDDIVVSDDGTDDRSRELVSRAFPNVRYVEGPRRGLCANRNVAAAAANGTHVLFIDDDARLGETFVARALEALERSTESERSRTIVTGVEINYGIAVFPKEQNFLGYQQRPYAIGESLRTIVINCTLFPIEAVRAFRFDEHLVYGYDEVDFATRATAAGYRIVLAPEARSEHFPANANRDYYRPFIDASRLYVTFKRYRSTDDRPIAALFYAVLAPLHLFAHRLLRGGFASVGGTLKTLETAKGYVAHEASSRRVLRRGFGRGLAEFAPKNLAHETNVVGANHQTR